MAPVQTKPKQSIFSFYVYECHNMMSSSEDELSHYVFVCHRPVLSKKLCAIF